MPKRHKGRLAVMLVAVHAAIALCAGGCATVAGNGATGGKTSTRECTPVSGKNILFQNQMLADSIEITDMKSSMAGGVLKVQASARISPRAKDQDMLPFMYRFFWFDAQGKGIAAAGAGPWQPAMIFGRDTVTIQGVAPDPRASEFRLMIQAAGDSHC